MVHPHPDVQAIGLDVDLSDTLEASAASLLGTLDTHLSFDASQPGKHHGHLILPSGAHHDGQGHVRLPVCVIRGETSGPCITLLSGVHGDEFEGPLTLHQLAQELSADRITGCVTLLPSLNVAGLQTGLRCSPLDNLDLDQCFPGTPVGTISERVAYEVFERFVRPADLVVDLRSGGSSLRFAASAAVRFSADHTGQKTGRSRHAKRDIHQQQSWDRQQTSEAAMIAFGAPNSVRLPPSKRNSCLQGATEAAATPYLQTELGGGGNASAETLSIAHTGCCNLLRHLGVLDGEIQLRATRMLEVRDASFYLHATTHGMLCPHARLGQEIYRGDPLLAMVNLEDSGAPPHLIRVPRNGVLLALRDRGPTKPGDLLAIIADEVHG